VIPIAQVASTATEHTTSGVVDADALARTLSAELIVDGSIRVSGETARTNLRVFDLTGGAPWTARFDGKASDAFALEDEIATQVCEVLELRLANASGKRGPQDKAARALYDEALRAVRKTFDVAALEDTAKKLEEADRQHPNDPWIMTALGNVLNALWNNRWGDPDNSLIARAEELSLRAMAIDPTIGEPYSNVAMVRLQFGELRAAVRGFRDAIARSPLEGSAHAYLGQLLGESGYVEEAFRRIELAARIEPAAAHTSGFEIARLAALIGDDARYESTMRRLRAEAPMIAALIDLRVSVWRNDRSMLERLATYAPAPPPQMEMWIAPMRAALLGQPIERESYVEAARSPHGSLRRRTYMYQLATEARARLGRADAFDTLESAASLLLVDVVWLDKCGALDHLRDDPRFARVRAITAQRAASMWS
jgi:eukaryotic-like serine/threonine-protein kinase